MRTVRLLIYMIPFLLLSALLFSRCGSPSSDSREERVNNDSLKTAEMDSNAEVNALPYQLEFVLQQYNNNPPLPRLQSYVATMTKEGYLFVIGGRRQGLHTFKGAPEHNFLPDSSNNFMYVIDIENGYYWSFNVDSLAPELSAPLQSTNQEFYHDRTTDLCYLVGGYGWNAKKTDMLTFNTLISFKVEDVVALIKDGQPSAKIASYIKMAHDDRLAVTGGELFKLNSNFYLVFGQKFTGQYRAFGGTDFKQEYTEKVKIFTLDPNSLKILSYGANTSTLPGNPFHRRDGNIIADINPSNGKPRITAFGGVFQEGIIAPYTYPVYISSPATPVIDTNNHQKFSQYECPVISIYDSSYTNKTIYHTFFGGIGHYYYFQTPSQKAAYDTVTKEGRNDGFPFVEDISTFLEKADGTYKEYIATSPIPGNRLLGTSAKFMPDNQLISKGVAYNNGVINLNAIPIKTRMKIGYIYGVIEAQNPLPLTPNKGSFVTNSVFAVYLTRTPTPAIPVSNGHESLKNDSKLLRK
ncbi:MAG: hypothetical protein ABIR03_04105 [Ginsengibacter sp.]